jgi:hypothetical protein
MSPGRPSRERHDISFAKLSVAVALTNRGLAAPDNDQLLASVAMGGLKKAKASLCGSQSLHKGRP